MTYSTTGMDGGKMQIQGQRQISGDTKGLGVGVEGADQRDSYIPWT